MAKFKNKAVIIVSALMLLIGCAVGGSIAWLATTTDTVTNTFTVGDINLELKETTGNSYSAVPGTTVSKNPKVTVKSGSEACYLFVKVTESNNTYSSLSGKIIGWEIADGWTPYTGVDGVVDGVYWREVSKGTADTTFGVLKGDHVTYNSGITKNMLTTINGSNNQPKLSFRAAAVQMDNLKLSDAYEQISSQLNG